MTHPYPPSGLRRLITLFTLAGAFMTQLDATIANVALPHMQASTSASREQITWVLTSYIVMAAVFTPLSGWLAQRIGRRRVFLGSVIGFTLASALCGLAATLDQLIAFRLLQGALGSALLPLSQAIMLEINPPEKHGSALALWGVGAVIGPIVGPLTGGWLTEVLNWRWVFLVNLPIGIATFVGLLATLPQSSTEGPPRKLDVFGFAMLAMTIACIQLVLDRGQIKDWFSSTEICVEAVLAATGLYAYVVHAMTTREPFVPPVVLRDSNFLVGNVLGFFLGGLMYGVMALVAPMLAELMHYPIKLVGLVTAPRGVGTMITMLTVGRVINRVDPRIMLLAGVAICGWSLWMLDSGTLEMDATMIIVSGFIQGIGAGLMFVPISVVVFATLQPQFRNEGAALNSLIRNMAGSMWIAILQTVTIRSEATMHSRLVEGVRADNPVVAWRYQTLDLASPGDLAATAGEISRQALMVAYNNAYWVLLMACLVVLPTVLLVRPAQTPPGAPPPPPMLD
ncbi:MAG: DHA2 family efflux MFS transporter permease subunit [Sphingomonadales bacterium]|nr:DHA2 family efflux MFS transporter permease subunit [Sphingomonadales bacterium]